MYFGSILDPFCIHFGYLGEVVEKTPQGTSKIHVLGPLGDPIWAPFFDKKWFFFQCKNSSFFLLIFYWILGPFWEAFGDQNSRKNDTRTEKVIFRRWASRLHESSILESRGAQNPSKRHQKMDWKISQFFDWKKHRKLTPKGSQKGAKMTPEGIQKTIKKNMKNH